MNTTLIENTLASMRETLAELQTIINDPNNHGKIIIMRSRHAETCLKEAIDRLTPLIKKTGKNTQYNNGMAFDRIIGGYSHWPNHTTNRKEI